MKIKLCNMQKNKTKCEKCNWKYDILKHQSNDIYLCHTCINKLSPEDRRGFLGKENYINNRCQDCRYYEWNIITPNGDQPLFGRCFKLIEEQSARFQEHFNSYSSNLPSHPMCFHVKGDWYKSVGFKRSY